MSLRLAGFAFLGLALPARTADPEHESPDPDFSLHFGPPRFESTNELVEQPN
jgi:hypothetical protein